MKVFKFGGASVSTAERIRNVKEILASYSGQPLLVVISAMGKTTNALETVVETFYRNEKEEALRLFEAIKQSHLDICTQLTPVPLPQLADLFTEVEWLLHDKPVRNYDYYYDQVVCIGELLSTAIISHYLQTEGISNQWLDVRDIIRTDNNFRDARIDWVYTNEKVQTTVLPLFRQTQVLITQGFIGATDENESTTLGREGSDYTAAVFTHLLDAGSQTIWKDVQGVMNADPKLYPDAEWIRELTYREVIEMAYYGAQVIHPKTIKPLQNKDIPLYVKSFLHPQEEGTVIHNRNIAGLPPIIVYKQAQVLVELTSRDYSFVSEGLNSEIDILFQRLKFKPNLTQITAISILCLTDNLEEKLDQFAQAAGGLFDVHLEKGLSLLTIRHYNEDILAKLTAGKQIVLRQQTRETVQVVMREQ
ncbi:aspartate kinase [Cnuella takakiae]|uniref:Aspartokinase n=1 Tax=Cnuella takakiae TaxID=1302690 RepID=A0A1M5GDE7_9BACT|nr:aspartate kinase [Cnuella takakiae]OLY92376.1 aspartate kinase [Cnuella takakiae]SHG01716.1 aspartate kinase [Cnuella takakiae]